MIRRTLVLAAALVPLGCTAAATRNEGPPRPVALEIDNNLALPTDLTVYAVTEGGTRRLIGSVPPARNVTFQFTPDSYSTQYRLVARMPLGRQLRSEAFVVGSSMTGQIVWMLVPNLIGFRDVEEPDSAVRDTTPR
jgi:hypothetical protein